MLGLLGPNSNDTFLFLVFKCVIFLTDFNDADKVLICILP